MHEFKQKIKYRLMVRLLLAQAGGNKVQTLKY